MQRPHDAFLMLKRFKRDGLKLADWRNSGVISDFQQFHGKICIEIPELSRLLNAGQFQISKDFGTFRDAIIGYNSQFEMKSR